MEAKVSNSTNSRQRIRKDKQTTGKRKTTKKTKKKVYMNEKPQRYLHSIFIIHLLINIKLKTSASFRAIAKIAVIININFNLSLKIPSHETVIIWVEKIGYYRLAKSKPSANDWIIILDHSVSIGQKKLFVIYGIRESDINFNRPIKLSDLTPLRQICKKKWSGEIISSILSELKNELHHIIYAVGDHGSDIKKGLELAEIPHVHDVTHHFALILEKLYKKDTEYQELTKKLSHVRMTIGQTDISHFLPNKQRTKSRYLNINIISDFSINMLKYLDKTDDEKVIEKFNWLKEYSSLIRELDQIRKVVFKIEKIVKTNGLNTKTIKKCYKILSVLSTSKAIQLKEQVKLYLYDTLNLLSDRKSILCTSDIIESAFGKYKNYISCNSMAGITRLALCISAFTASLSKNEIREALEYTKMQDLKKWTTDNIGTTLYQKRKIAFAGL